MIIFEIYERMLTFDILTPKINQKFFETITMVVFICDSYDVTRWILTHERTIICVMFCKRPHTFSSYLRRDLPSSFRHLPKKHPKKSWKFQSPGKGKLYSDKVEKPKCEHENDENAKTQELQAENIEK